MASTWLVFGKASVLLDREALWVIVVALAIVHIVIEVNLLATGIALIASAVSARPTVYIDVVLSHDCW